MKKFSPTNCSVKATYERYKGICWLCKLPVPQFHTHTMGLNATRDHIIKKEHGGKYRADNIALAHHYCNSSRDTHTEEQLRERIIFLFTNNLPSGLWSG